jgi:pimeloyl-ACP methyl ester carboxylesterase
MPIVPFSIPFSQLAVDDLCDRLRRTRWLDEIPGSAWTYGFDRQFLLEICDYWMNHFVWEDQVKRLSEFHHHQYLSNGTATHFIYERGRGPDPIPLILTHGWPGSFVEMAAIIPLLTDPAAHGSDSADSFDVVVPSLPGFGFSTLPSGGGMNAFRIADLWVKLMDQLGYSRFAAQGGDLGAGVSTALGLHHADRILGIHLNFVPGSYRPCLEPGTRLEPAEEQFLADASCWSEENGAYAHIQRTRPQTAAYALNDSPVGLAAWILEKFRDWSDCSGDLYRRFSRDELLTNVTLYWMTQTISSSFQMYYEGRSAPLHFEKGSRVHVPCAFAHFPKEILFPPRLWVERGYNVQHWTNMPSGGHFAAAEEPELLAADIRAFFRAWRKS